MDRPNYTQLNNEEITVSPDDDGGLHLTLTASDVRYREPGDRVYIKGSAWTVEDTEGGAVYLAHDIGWPCQRVRVADLEEGQTILNVGILNVPPCHIEGRSTMLLEIISHIWTLTDRQIDTLATVIFDQNDYVWVEVD